MSQHIKHPRFNYRQTGVYLGLVLVVVLAFALNYRNAKDDERERCEAGTDTRMVQRATVEAVYNLAVGSIQRGPAVNKLSKAEVQQYNEYIQRVNAFRENTYKLIRPSDLCAPYVKDDKVVPPTPPTPPIVQTAPSRSYLRGAR